MRGIRMLMRGRRMQSELFISGCIIRRPVRGDLDDETGTYPMTYTVVYGEVVGEGVLGGPCSLKFTSSILQEVDAQSQILVKQQPTLKLPVVGSERVRVGDIVEITSNPLDVGREGLMLRVTGDHVGSMVTARRFPTEVVSNAEVNG